MFLSEAVVHSYLRCSSRAHRMNVFTGGGKTKNTATAPLSAVERSAVAATATALDFLSCRLLLARTSSQCQRQQQFSWASKSACCSSAIVRLHASVRMTNKFRTPLCIRAAERENRSRSESERENEVENARRAVPNQMMRLSNHQRALLFPKTKRGRPVSKCMACAGTKLST